MTINVPVPIPVAQTDLLYTVPAGVDELWLQAVTANGTVSHAAASNAFTLTTTEPLVLRASKGGTLAGLKLYFTTPGTGTVSIMEMLRAYS